MNKSESKYYNTAVKMDEAFLELLNIKEFEYITVKEICEKAKVNRSTFYLHYETVNDLLLETEEYINGKFLSYFIGTEAEKVEVNSLDDKDLNFIKPKYLVPWLNFIKDNKRLFKTVIKRFNTFDFSNTFGEISSNVITPVLERLIPEKEDRRYILAFSVEGIMAVVKEWLRNDCDKDVLYVSSLIIRCFNNNV